MERFKSIVSTIKSKLRQTKIVFTILVFILLITTTFLIVNQQKERQISRSNAYDASSSAEIAHGHAQAPVQPFVDDPKRGLNWKGLRKGQKGGPCGEKFFEVVDKGGEVMGCTHGPDPAPPGVDATKSVLPLTSAGTISQALTTGTIACDGDGTSGYRVQTLYVRASDSIDRYGEFASSFIRYAQIADQTFNDSAARSGAIRHIRFVTVSNHDSSCSLAIDRVVVSPTGDDSWDNVIAELKNKGYNRNDRKYLFWLDSNAFCGLGQTYDDDRVSSTNYNELRVTFAGLGNGCWGNGAEAHELGHALGGVQFSAPHSSGEGHCYEGQDKMCAPTNGTTMVYRCPNVSPLYDCDQDDYFSINPPTGSYVSTHLNIANSRFLLKSQPSIPTNTPTPTPTSLPVQNSVVINLKASADTGVNSQVATTNYATAIKVFVNYSPKQIMYATFDLRPYGGRTLIAAFLQIKTAKYPNSVRKYIHIANAPTNVTYPEKWIETIKMTWNTKISYGSSIGYVAATANTSTNTNKWLASTDFTSYLASKMGQVVTLAIDQTSSNIGTDFYTREGGAPPILTIKYLSKRQLLE